ncbi:preQ(1) synthase [Dongia sp.]|uniref:preQ(1) synthase n=1 Tax=Dongia sp. TaxID=1977262 RepID=UPI0037534D32
MAKPKYTTLTQLGAKSDLPSEPSVKTLERVPNPHPSENYTVRFTAPEFTCLCPVTGQPDFAHFVIDYLPAKWLVESKSLKLYLHSYRNHGGFHEGTTLDIAKDLIAAIAPQWIRIGGYWYPRGGMPIDVFFEKGKKPADLWVPEQGVEPYRGRG